MKNFFTNLIERHAQTAGIIEPRLPGVFEPDRITSVNFAEPKENQFIASEKDENSDNVSPSNSFENKIEFIKREPFFQKNTISTVETKSNLRYNNTEDKFHLNNESGDSTETEEKSHIEKPVSHLKREFVIKSEKSEQNSNSFGDNKNTGLGTPPIKPVINQVTVESSFPNNSIEESKLSNNVINKNNISSEKHSADSAMKKISLKNERNGNMGLKLPERFNKWMNEPVKQSQQKGNEVSTSQTIKVNIGRIEVRAIMDQHTAPVARKPAFKPKLSLEDYLNQRNGGKR